MKSRPKSCVRSMTVIKNDSETTPYCGGNYVFMLPYNQYGL